MHLDDLHDLMPHAHFASLKRWLEQHSAIIVRCDEIHVSPVASGAHWGERRGKWGVDELYPPYGGYRKLLEDARAAGPPPPLPLSCRSGAQGSAAGNCKTPERQTLRPSE